MAESEEIVEGEVIEENETALAQVTEAERRVVQRYVHDDTPLSLSQVIEHVNLMHRMLNEIMVEEVHYGKIPGTNDKVVLLQPGGDLINLVFKLVPQFQVERIPRENGHMDFDCKCRLVSRDGVLIAEGEAYASTMESKYRYRKGSRVCPDCGKEAIIPGKAEYGGGWLCFKKKGGCGAKWADGTAQADEFATMEVGQVENDNIADTYNTVKKMGCKRAKMSADNNAVAGTDIFTVDLDDMAANEAAYQQAHKSSKKPTEGGSGPLSPSEGTFTPAGHGVVSAMPAEVGELAITEAQVQELLAALQGSSLSRADLEAKLAEKTGGQVTKLEQLKVKSLVGVLRLIANHPFS